METPMMQQWRECKEKSKGAILFFRLGDFYEAFYEDAELVSKELSLTLTKRQTSPMCGVPFHAAENYIDKLIAKGLKVAIAEQMEDPKMVKGLLKRDISRVISPGTVVNSSLIQDKANNFFAAIVENNKVFGLAVIDLSTSDFKVSDFSSEKDLLEEIYRLKPKEFLIPQSFQKKLLEDLLADFPFFLNIKEDSFFDAKLTKNVLLEHFKMASLEDRPSHISAGALLFHLHELHFDLSYIKTLHSENLSQYMSLDRTVLRSLELTESFMSRDKKNTLLELLDNTLTPMGGRLLSHWLKYPLLDVLAINKRLDAVEEFIKNPDTIFSLSSALSKVRDLERLITKISGGFASPKDLVFLKDSLKNIPLMKEILASQNSSLIKEDLFLLKDLSSIVRTVEEAIVEDPPLRLSDGNLFKAGFNRELDELSEISKSGKNWIASYQNRLKEETGIKTLKVGFTRSFGYYIEISKGQLERTPPFLQRVQTLVNGERFTSEDLKIFESKVLTAEEKMRSLENSLFNDLRAKIATFMADIMDSAKAVARIDALLSLAKLARGGSYTRPEVNNLDKIIIEEGRHPIIENVIGKGRFISNDSTLSKEQSLILITGPNMAGKSTYIRQTAVIVIMAQMGSFVPAKKAIVGVVDKLFSRIGASDDIARGQSTFMVEMIETANILNSATPKSLVILDEIGRGTSTYDGISIAWSVAEHLLGLGTKTLFATHYWELTALSEKGAVNLNVAIKETPSGILFLHKIVAGGTDKSYGIHVARLANLPSSVIRRAQVMLESLEKKRALQCHQEPTPSPIKDLLLKLDLNQLTPIQALQRLLELKEWAEK